MAIFINRQQIQEALGDLAKKQQRAAKRPLRVRWHDGDVGHVEILPAIDGAPSPSQSLIVFSNAALDISNLDTVSDDVPLRLACWRDSRDEIVVRVVHTPATDSTSHEVCFIPSHSEVFARQRGLIETDRLHANRVAIFGVGSVGSVCAVELAKCGVGKISLIDHDRLELHNVARHACGISSLGRRKVNAVRELLLDKNPASSIEAHALDVLERPEVVEQIIRRADISLIATDNNASRLLINSLCVQYGKTAIYGRAMTRAWSARRRRCA